jgi:hypothetical protein
MMVLLAKGPSVCAPLGTETMLTLAKIAPDNDRRAIALLHKGKVNIFYNP